MTFDTMTPEQLSAELNRFRDQIARQKIPITDGQKRRFYALQKAYKRASDIVYN